MRAWDIRAVDPRDPDLRNAYFEYVETVFPGANFRTWYDLGFWVHDYTPHCVVDRGRIVANVSAARMRLIVDSQEFRAVQLGAVGTVPAYRGRGLARLLMQHVLAEYDASSDLCFLFANDEVLDFYPRFGFERRTETRFISTTDLPEPSYAARRLDLNREDDLELARSVVNRRLVLTRRLGAGGYGWVTFWHFLSLYPENLHYIDEVDAIFVVSERNGQAHIHEVIYTRAFDLASVLPRVLRGPRIQSVSFHFPPDVLAYSFDETRACDDAPLFVRGRFDPGHRQYRLPVTAQT